MPIRKRAIRIPLVKLGIVPVAGGPVVFVDLHGYSEGSMLLTRAGWTPDGEKVYFYVQDRAQTWLDFCTASRGGGKPTRLFRDKTKAWVSDPGSAALPQGWLLPACRASAAAGNTSITSARTANSKRAVTSGAVGGAHSPSSR